MLDTQAPPQQDTRRARQAGEWCARKIREYPRTTIVILCISLILLVSLLPASFHAVEYDEYGLDKYDITSSVDYGHVYANGNHYTGVGHSFLKFPRRYQFEVVSGQALRVFSQEGLEYPFQYSLQWRLIPDSIPDIYRTMKTSYRDRAINLISSSVKNTMTRFDIETIINNRSMIDRELTAAVQAAVRTIGIEITTEKFQIDKPILPATITDRLLRTQVQLVSNQEQELRRQESIVVQATTVIVQNIMSNATRVLTKSVAQADRIVSEARSSSFAIVESANQRGLQVLFSGLGITNTSTRERLKLILVGSNSTVFYGLRHAQSVVNI